VGSAAPIETESVNKIKRKTTTYNWIKSFLKITIEGKAIYGNLENKINTLYWPVENSIPKNNDRRRNDADGKLQKVSGRCLILSSDHYVFSLGTSKKVCQTYFVEKS
jgi:hypothetical protein